MLWGGHYPKAETLGKTEAGEKRMKLIGKIEIPQEALLAVLKIDK